MDLGIYYFSGTGNCLAIAKFISSQIENSRIFSIAKENENENIEINCEQVLFIFPTYAYEMPKFVSRFIKKANIKSKYIAAAASYASSYGAVFSELKRILKRKNLKLDFAQGIKSVENYIPMFGLSADEKLVERNAVMKEQSLAFAQDLLKLETNIQKRHKFGMTFIAKMFKTVRGFFAKLYRVKKTCNGCGMCARICPSKAIKMKKGKPKFTLKCEHCQGCLNWCPKKAIRFIRYSPSSRRYTHPDIKINEINQPKAEQE